MSTIYLLLLLGVALVVLFLMAEAVVSVTRRPVWEQRQAQRSTLGLVETREQRVQDLPFIGADRRTATQPAAGSPEEAQKRAA